MGKKEFKVSILKGEKIERFDFSSLDEFREWAKKYISEIITIDSGMPEKIRPSRYVINKLESVMDLYLKAFMHFESQEDEEKQNT